MICTPDQKHLLTTALEQHRQHLHALAETMSGDARDCKLVEADLAERLVQKLALSQYVNLFTETR